TLRLHGLVVLFTGRGFDQLHVCREPGSTTSRRPGAHAASGPVVVLHDVTNPRTEGGVRVTASRRLAGPRVPGRNGNRAGARTAAPPRGSPGSSHGGPCLRSEEGATDSRPGRSGSGGVFADGARWRDRS